MFRLTQTACIDAPVDVVWAHLARYPVPKHVRRGKEAGDVVEVTLSARDPHGWP